MTTPFKSPRPQDLAEQAELAKPREARASGAFRVSDADVPGPDEHTLRLGFRISRPNAPVPVLPSILVDASYAQAVSSVADRMRGRSRSLTFAAAGAFLGCALALLTVQTVERVRRTDAPATATTVVKTVGASLRTPLVPMSVSPAAEPPHRTLMDQQDAARHVHGAEQLRRAGSVRDARRLLTDVLKDRSGYPPALAAMAELELDSGQAAAAVRWARLAVRALPWSVKNWELLGRACSVAGLNAESAGAYARATLLHKLQQ